ncbi:MAG: hypothetical protein AAB724_01340 [Patescibacteria group bacterium]
MKPLIKWGLLMVMVLEIISLFISLRVFDNLVSDQDNYSKNSVTTLNFIFPFTNLED